MRRRSTAPRGDNRNVHASIARGIAIFFSAFTLLNLAGDLRFAGERGNVWWIDLWPLPANVAAVVLALVAIVFLLSGFLRSALPYAVGIVSAAALLNAIRYYRLLDRHEIRSQFPIPLSILILAAMLVIATARQPSVVNRRAVAITVLACAVLFPLAQIATFGMTDYRRPADLIVVFGAKAYADGTPSNALADRVATGCELYRAGLAPRLLFSGGPNEPEAMRRFAMSLGVPASAIVDDPAGVNTEATARNTMRMVRASRILAVSHFYHLPRVKMTYQRYGANVFTVPSRDTAGWWLWNLGRETAAFWRYYLRRV